MLLVAINILPFKAFIKGRIPKPMSIHNLFFDRQFYDESAGVRRTSPSPLCSVWLTMSDSLKHAHSLVMKDKEILMKRYMDNSFRGSFVNQGRDFDV